MRRRLLGRNALEAGSIFCSIGRAINEPHDAVSGRCTQFDKFSRLRAIPAGGRRRQIWKRGCVERLKAVDAGLGACMMGAYAIARNGAEWQGI